MMDNCIAGLMPDAFRQFPLYREGGMESGDISVQAVFSQQKGFGELPGFTSHSGSMIIESGGSILEPERVPENIASGSFLFVIWVFSRVCSQRSWYL